jgi:hypothetical protein
MPRHAGRILPGFIHFAHSSCTLQHEKDAFKMVVDLINAYLQMKKNENK